jgi:formylglycine-generating enzyme required for sulfatase activity
MVRERMRYGSGLVAVLAMMGCAPPRPPASPDAAVRDVATDSSLRSPDRADVIAPADDVPAGPCDDDMVFVAAGRFMMGDPHDDDPGAQPVHGVRLSAFCIDRSEVTVAAYGRCDAAGCTAPGSEAGCNALSSGRDEHPVNCVAWEQARAYCRWRGGDLPTEAQWEFAARGGDARTYPWGEALPDAQLSWSGGSARPTGTSPVGSFRDGDTPNGLVDMAGNVWEWVLDWNSIYSGDGTTEVVDPTGPTVPGMGHVFKGASWICPSAISVRPAFHDDFGYPGLHSAYGGFRCVGAPR